MAETQTISLRQRISRAALPLSSAAILVAALTIVLDKSLPYRIGPNYYGQYLWVDRLTVASLVMSIVVMLFSIVCRRLLPFLFSLISLASLIFFIGGAHSGPNPQAWCYNNLRNIAAAKDRAVAELSLTNGAVMTAEQISKYIDNGQNRLRCAEGGQYIIGSVGTEPRCSFHGSLSEIEDGWKRESPKYLGQKGQALIRTNQGK